MADARRLFEAQSYNEAVELLGPIIAATNDADAIHLLAECFEKLDLKGEAGEVFEHLANLGGDESAERRRRAARLYAEAGRRDKAMALVVQLRRDDPTDPDAAAIFAALTGLGGKPKSVDDVTNELIASDDLAKLRQALQRIGHDNRDIRNLTLFSKLVDKVPDDPYLRASLSGFAREFCDYPILEREEASMRAAIAKGDFRLLNAETPLHNLMWCSDEALNRQALNVAEVCAPPGDAGARRLSMPHQWGDRLRIGYLSNDLWDDHATMRLFQSVLTAHDPARFDVTLFCYTRERFIGFDSGNRKSWGRIVRIDSMSDEEAASAIRSRDIDILVDLKGHTGGSRSALMNHPIAPVHVQWLGFPGSCVHVDCDYAIGDPIVLPQTSQPHYHEKFCRLPETYQPNDPVFRVQPQPVSRAEAGLPEGRFVFSAFNSQRKNSLEGMALWARVLRANPDSLFWLMVDGEHARASTLAHFEKLGVSGDRIQFAPKMAYANHMARVQASDLGLDSFPYNGHTTTSDMLWAGLPVITRKGSNFASRVSESLLHAVGMPELVAEDDDGFVALATRLAQDAALLAGVKAKLKANRYTTPLFDADRFCRHLEDAYDVMAARVKAGKAPEHFDVPARPV